MAGKANGGLPPEGKANGKVEVLFGSPDPKVNSIRYFEEPGQGDPVLGSIYIRRASLAQIGNPKRVKVTIEAL